MNRNEKYIQKINDWSVVNFTITKTYLNINQIQKMWKIIK